MTFTSTDWGPIADNSKSNGKANRLWSVNYAGTSTINTSDERVKQQFRSQSDKEKAAALEIKSNICLFKFNDAVDLKGDRARWHVGVKAQQVISILESHDLSWQDYGFICYDEWEAAEEIIETWEDELDPDGNLIKPAGSVIIQHAQEAGNLYAVRYDELSMFILNAL